MQQVRQLGGGDAPRASNRSPGALTCAKLGGFVQGKARSYCTERLNGRLAPPRSAGPFSWRLFARADESATETNLPARPLFARVGGRVLILGPAIRRGAFFRRAAHHGTLCSQPG